MRRLPTFFVVALAASLTIGCTKAITPPVVELAADGSLSLDGEPITMADAMATLSDYSSKVVEITLRIDPNVAYRHVDALQTELQKNKVERVVVTLSQ